MNQDSKYMLFPTNISVLVDTYNEVFRNATKKGRKTHLSPFYLYIYNLFKISYYAILVFSFRIQTSIPMSQIKCSTYIILFKITSKSSLKNT